MKIYSSAPPACEMHPLDFHAARQSLNCIILCTLLQKSKMSQSFLEIQQLSPVIHTYGHFFCHMKIVHILLQIYRFAQPLRFNSSH